MRLWVQYPELHRDEGSPQLMLAFGRFGNFLWGTRCLGITCYEDQCSSPDPSIVNSDLSIAGFSVNLIRKIEQSKSQEFLDSSPQLVVTWRSLMALFLSGGQLLPHWKTHSVVNSVKFLWCKLLSPRKLWAHSIFSIFLVDIVWEHGRLTHGNDEEQLMFELQCLFALENDFWLLLGNTFFK